MTRLSGWSARFEICDPWRSSAPPVTSGPVVTHTMDTSTSLRQCLGPHDDGRTPAPTSLSFLAGKLEDRVVELRGRLQILLPVTAFEAQLIES
jgi:hypothetical protein